MNIEPVDYVLKFHKDFYYPICDQYKITTIRRESKPLNIGDYCFADFIDSDKVLVLEICEHYAIKFKDLSKKEAEREGYNHPDLLKHELRNIYPDIKDDDYVYIYRFKHKYEPLLIEEYNNGR